MEKPKPQADTNPNQTVGLNFYCPLRVQTEEDDGWNLYDTDPRILIPYGDEIRAALQKETRGEDMAKYYHGVAADKLTSAQWDVAYAGDDLYGVIHTQFTEPLTEVEQADLSEWVTSQNADGFGEGFEQRPLETEDGNLYVSFWSSDDGYFLFNDDEFEQYLSAGQQMGGYQ